MNLRFDLDLLNTGNPSETSHINFVIEVTNVAHDGFVFHGHHVLSHNDVSTTSGGDEDVGSIHDILQACHLIAVHGRLECNNWVNHGDDHTNALTTEFFFSTLPDVAVTCDNSGLATQQHIGAAHNAIG